MIEIHAVALSLFVFAFIAMACFGVLARQAFVIAQDDAEFWRSQYETLNTKVRPAFNDAAENLVPMTAAAHERLTKLRQALESKDAAS